MAYFQQLMALGVAEKAELSSIEPILNVQRVPGRTGWRILMDAAKFNALKYILWQRVI